jgi:prolyl 4-hydroxylase
MFNKVDSHFHALLNRVANRLSFIAKSQTDNQTEALMEAINGLWNEWLATNLNRGCTHESIVEAMAHAGIDVSMARDLVRSAATARNGEHTAFVDTTVNDASPYEYDACPVAEGNCIRAYDRDVSVLMRIARPQIIVLDDVLSGDECEDLIVRSRHRLKRSTTVNPDNGSEDVIEMRTSEGCWFPRCEDALIGRLDRRIAALMNWPIDHGEGLQVLHYAPGGEYRPHFDYFPPDQEGSAVHTSHGGQRVATLIVYLNDVEGGGATIFPQACAAVTARRGGAVYFRYMNGRGQLDPMTLHGGAPVTSGEKWIMTKWMRERVCE